VPVWTAGTLFTGPPVPDPGRPVVLPVASPVADASRPHRNRPGARGLFTPPRHPVARPLPESGSLSRGLRKSLQVPQGPTAPAGPGQKRPGGRQDSRGSPAPKCPGHPKTRGVPKTHPPVMGPPVASRPACRRPFLSQVRHTHGRTRLSDRPCCRHPHSRPPASALDRPHNRPGPGSRRPVGHGRPRSSGANVRIRGGREAGTASPSPGRQGFPSWPRTRSGPAGRHHFLTFFSASRPPAPQRPASGTIHRSVPVMQTTPVASHPFVPIPDFDTLTPA